jgi:hypothetical protein
MLNNISEIFSLEEVALENIDLLPEGKKVIYFVTILRTVFGVTAETRILPLRFQSMRKLKPAFYRS